MNGFFKTLQKVGKFYRNIAPLLTLASATVLLLFSYYLADKLKPLNKSIGENTFELQRISAREQSNKTSFEKFEKTVTDGFSTVLNKIDNLNTRLSRIEGKLE